MLLKFNSHLRITSYSLWSNYLREKTIKEDTNTHLHSKNHNLCLLHTQVI